MSRLRGDPRKLADNVVKELGKDLEKFLKDALSTSIQLIEDKKDRILKEMLSAMREEYSRIDESYRSFKARLELELKASVAREKSKFIDEVISSALKRIKEKKNEEWYRKFMENVFEKLARDSRDVGELVVEVSEDDRELAKTLVERFTKEGAKLTLSEGPASIVGGAIARNKDSSVVLDYSLDLFVKENETLLRSIAARALFGHS